MATTKEMIREWLFQGKKREGVTHVMIVCDTFDWEDYPVYITGGQEAAHRKYEEIHGKNMQKVMEVYNLSMDIEAQLNEPRAFND